MGTMLPAEVILSAAPASTVEVRNGVVCFVAMLVGAGAEVATIMLREDVPSASVSGFGFVARARFGFFDFDAGDYDPADFRDLGITTLSGTLAWMDGARSIHAHAAGGGRDFHVVGGHVLSLVVGRGSFELTITVHPARMSRTMEPEIRAKVLRLDGVS